MAVIEGTGGWGVVKNRAPAANPGRQPGEARHAYPHGRCIRASGIGLLSGIPCYARGLVSDIRMGADDGSETCIVKSSPRVVDATRIVTERWPQIS